jgi:hypothetical protein
MKKFKKLPSQKYLIECLDYNPETGSFIWKQRPNHHFIDNRVMSLVNTQRSGKIAGYIPESGYLMIGIDSTRYRAHRIAWKIMTGNDPENEIDHIDMDRSNCRFSNLRSAEGKENARNRTKYKNNKSGYKGVSFNVQYGMFQSEIMKDRVRYNLGYYDSAIDAHNAYCNAAKNLHGDFARD